MNPTLKFGAIDFKNKTENPQDFKWINIGMNGRIILTLYKIKVQFFDKKGGTLLYSQYVMEECPVGCHLSIDVSTEYTYGPVKQAAQLLKLNNLDLCGDPDKLPIITFEVLNVDKKIKKANKIIEISLMPEEYIVNYSTDEDEPKCKLGIKTHNTNYGWSLGRKFLKPFLFVYDFEDERLGFGRAK